MTTAMDHQIEEVYEEWQQTLAARQRRGMFVYLSDHGDRVGDRNLYGKQTFFEGSARIPLLFEGAGIAAGRRVSSPVSIVDLGATLCDFVDAPTPPDGDGMSLRPFLDEESEPPDSRTAGSNAATQNDASDGPDESQYGNRSVLSEYMEWESSRGYYPGRMLRRETCDGWEIEMEIARQEAQQRQHELLRQWGAAIEIEDPERYHFKEQFD